MQNTPEQLAELPEVLLVQQVADVLRVALRTAYKLIREGDIHSVRVGRMWRVPKASLLDYLRRGSGPAA